MEIKPISSSSLGNACIISYNDHHLLLDAGVAIDKISKAMNYQLTKLDGALISHEHGDHCKAVKDLQKMSIDCYMSKGTAEALNLKNYKTHEIAPFKQFSIGPWIILPFDLIHDANEPLGFLIQIENDKLLYACDTAYIKYVFQGLTHIMIECNHSLEILNQRIKEGLLPRAMKYRLMKTHMNIETCKRFFMVNDLSRVKEIWLLHASDRHADEAQFKSEIQKITGKVVKVA